MPFFLFLNTGGKGGVVAAGGAGGERQGDGDDLGPQLEDDLRPLRVVAVHLHLLGHDPLCGEVADPGDDLPLFPRFQPGRTGQGRSAASRKGGNPADHQLVRPAVGEGKGEGEVCRRPYRAKVMALGLEDDGRCSPGAGGEQEQEQEQDDPFHENPKKCNPPASLCSLPPL